MTKRICVSCLEPREEEEFNWRYKALGIRHKTCKYCHHKHQDNWYESHKEQHLENVHARKRRVRDEAREWVWNYLSTHPCEWVDENGRRCGESNPIVLEFHHLHGKDKAVSEMVAGGYPIEKIQSEISKCVVYCSNHHRIVTHKERGWFRGRK